MSNTFGNSSNLPSPAHLKERFLDHMRMQNASPRTLEQWNYTLRRLLLWLAEHGIDSVLDITADILSAYRRYLYHYRNPKTMTPIKFVTQAMYLVAVRRFFAWLAEQKILSDNIAAKLELPKEEQRLPTDVLSVSEVERVLNATDVATPLGIRDRAILETFYSTAMRCGELAALEIYDLSAERGVITIRQGKGRKDRVVPVGERALSWIAKYLLDVRPELVTQSNETVMFLSKNGRRLGRNHVSYVVRHYIDLAGIRKKGSCHLLRHTTATLMLENGADLRALQMLLGHARLNTTQLYTHVTIQRLKEVHAKTHPAKPDTPPTPPPSPPPPAPPAD